MFWEGKASLGFLEIYSVCSCFDHVDVYWLTKYRIVVFK
jgi:hypothetical protein